MRAFRIFVVALAPLLLIAAVPLSQQRLDLSLSAEPGQLLDIELPNVRGSLEIIGTDGETVTIEGEVSARRWRDDDELVVDVTADGIRIVPEWVDAGGDRRRRNARADLTIRVPRSFDVNVRVALGTTVRGVAGDFRVSVANDGLDLDELHGDGIFAVANGNLRVVDSELTGSLSNTNGSLRLERGSFAGRVVSTNGGARIERASGDLEVVSTNGTVRVGDVDGSLTGRTTNGNVEADEVAGGIEIETVNGTVRATLTSADSGDVDIETLNGDVDLVIPEGISARFDVSVEDLDEDRRRRREIDSDFALEIDEDDTDPYHYRARGTGAVGGGARTIEIRARNGDVRLRAG